MKKSGTARNLVLRALRVLRDQAVASIEAVEGMGLSVLSAIDQITAPWLPKLPGIVPAENFTSW